MSETVTSTRPARSVRTSWPIYVTSFVIAAVVAGSISEVFLSESLAALGIPDPGVVTTFGLPALRGVVWVLTALAAGSFMFSAFLIPPRHDGENDGEDLNGARLTVDGHIAARTAAWASISVACAALVMIPLVLSDVSGTPFSQVVLQPESWRIALSQVADARIWLTVAAFALVVGSRGSCAIPGGRRWRCSSAP